MSTATFKRPLLLVTGGKSDPAVWSDIMWCPGATSMSWRKIPNVLLTSSAWTGFGSPWWRMLMATSARCTMAVIRRFKIGLLQLGPVWPSFRSMAKQGKKWRWWWGSPTDRLDSWSKPFAAKQRRSLRRDQTIFLNAICQWRNAKHFNKPRWRNCSLSSKTPCGSSPPLLKLIQHVPSAAVCCWNGAAIQTDRHEQKHGLSWEAMRMWTP